MFVRLSETVTTEVDALKRVEVWKFGLDSAISSGDHKQHVICLQQIMTHSCMVHNATLNMGGAGPHALNVTRGSTIEK
jgi:hypothetical protein